MTGVLLLELKRLAFNTNNRAHEAFLWLFLLFRLCLLGQGPGTQALLHRNH